MAEETQKSNSSFLDKGIDLVKWIDSPFKLLEVIILATLAFGGYFAWDSRQVILQAITSQNTSHQSSLNHWGCKPPFLILTQSFYGTKTSQ